MSDKTSNAYRFLLIWGLVFFASTIGLANTVMVYNADDVETAMETAQPGDTLLMANGLWTDEWIVFQGEGEEQNPIVLRAETKGKVILNGISILRISGRYLIVDGLNFIGGYSNTTGAVIEFRNGSSRPAHHCRITNSAIIDYNPTSDSREYKWLSMYGTYNRVDHCFFEGKRNGGTTLVVWLDGSPNYHRIDHNYFGERPELGKNGGETIRVGTSDYSMSDSYTTVENNYFERCNGETEIISNKSGENVYRSNTFYDCEGTLTLRHGNKCLVEGNFFLGNSNYRAGGVRIIGEDHRVVNNYFYQLNGSGYRSAVCLVEGVPNSPLNRYFQVKRALVAFNTFVDCRNSLSVSVGSSSDQELPPVDCTMANNVVTTDAEIIEYENDPINMTYEGNVMWGSSLGIQEQVGILFQDPQLALESDGLYRPQSTSPILAAAVGYYEWLQQDIDGQPRTIPYDIGADQVSESPILRTPMTPETTGPDWLQRQNLPYLLTLRTSGSGTVSVDPPGPLYDPGTPVVVTAMPDSGWRFAGWDGRFTTDENPLQFVMDQNTVVIAIFEEDVPPVYSLRTFVFSSGGTIELDPPGGSYTEGTLVTVTAVPDEGWEFVQWGGDLGGSENPVSVDMRSDKSIMATFRQSSAVARAVRQPLEFNLLPNAPNPFNPSTMLSFVIPASEHVHLAVYNNLGQLVRVLFDDFSSAGEYALQWDGRNDAGDPVNSGIYFYQLRSGDHMKIRKMSLVR